VHQRDLMALGEQLADWLGPRLGADGPVEVSDIHAPSGSGMSSVTILLSVAWADQRRDLVVRLAPDDSSFPVFPSYDLRSQYDVMAAVGANSDIPVPPLIGFEESSEVLGSPFLVMQQVPGRTPSDNPPYVFGGWLYDATPEERRGMQDDMAGILAKLHAIPVEHFPHLVAAAGDDPLRTHFENERAYYAWTYADDDVRVPIIERAFDWLEEHWPTDSGEPVLSWGDARPGNIVFDGFTPVAVLDWEMASIAPRGLDVAWFPLIHAFFQDIANVFEMPGLPDFADPQEYAATYAERSGQAVADLHWYLVYNALRHGIVMARIKRRMIHFGEETAPEDPDDYVMHRALLERLMA